MPKYKGYYDRYNSDQRIPRSTVYYRQKKNKYNENGSSYSSQNDTSDANDTFSELHAWNYLQPNPHSDTEKRATPSETILSRESTFPNELLKSVCRCSSINIAEVLLMSMKILKKHSLSWEALHDIFLMLNCIFNCSVLPTSKYMLRKLLAVNTDLLNYHYKCKTCQEFNSVRPKEKIKCRCGSDVNNSNDNSLFIQIDLAEQLTKLFSNKTIVESLCHRLNRVKINENGLEDIYDGAVYDKYNKEDSLLGNPLNFSYTFNTDGCKAADASKISVWPIYMMLHELPEILRRKYMILVGLWVARTEPDMNIYLGTFVDQANILSESGFKWIWNGKEIISKFYPLGCCVDSVARCAMLCMKQFNGTHGCTYCEHPTENVDGVRKYPAQIDVPKLRSDESIRQQMHIAYNTKCNDVVGVRGPSALINLRHFDLVNGMVLDFMHACLLGVTELFTKIILTNAKQQYYVGAPNNIDLIDKRLLSIKPPSCLAKINRSIKERNLWKASEWLSWLIFYSLICLRGILKDKYYKNYARFVKAMTLLLSDTITPVSLAEASNLLNEFVRKFEIHFTKTYLHYNVHLLLHLCKNVENWGPLHGINTFPFENENKLLLLMKHCNYRIAQQIVFKLLTYQQLPLLENSNFISNKVKSFCDNLFKKRLKNISRVNDCILIGNGKKCVPSNNEKQCLQEVLQINSFEECLSFTRMIYKGYRFTIDNYKRNKKRRDSVIETIDNHYGFISRIYKIKSNESDHVIIFFKKVSITGNCSIKNIELPHLKQINMQRKFTLHVIRCSNLYRPCVLSKWKNNSYAIITIGKGMLSNISN